MRKLRLRQVGVIVLLQIVALASVARPAESVAAKPLTDTLTAARSTVHEVLALALGLLPGQADALLDLLGVDPVSLVPLQPEPSKDARASIPDQPGPDPSSPASRAQVTEAEYDAAAEDPGNAPYRGSIDASREQFHRAMRNWRGGDTDVPAVIEFLASAAELLHTPEERSIAPGVATSLAEIARHIVGRIVATFERAGAGPEITARLDDILTTSDAAVVDGRYSEGIGTLKDVFEFVAHLQFDISLFQKNIRDAFDSRTVGYSFVVAKNGLLVASGQNGLARTASDPPGKIQLVSKEMNIASVSKTLTAVAVLRLLEQNGLTIDSPIAPWLPNTWSTGPSVGQLTFRRLMTHTSGLNNNDGSQAYDYLSMRNAIANGVNAPQTFTYQNLNFSLFRVIIPRLAGEPVDDLVNTIAQVAGQSAAQDFDAVHSATLYKQYLQNELFQPMGIDGDCAPNDSSMTLLYNPNTTTSGINAGDWTNICGGGGWYLSTFELTTYLAHMRYDDSILSPAMRDVMNENFTGWMDPADYDWGDGTWGTYHNHGGDLIYDGNRPSSRRRGMDSCAISYPNGVQVSLLINSQGVGYPGHPNSTYQCAALEAAYDDAWVWVP